MKVRDRQKRCLQLEPLEARWVLSCDLTGNGVCDVEDLDALYDAGDFSVTASARQVDWRAVSDDSAAADGITHDFFVTTSEDIKFIQGAISIDESINSPFNVYNSPFGSDSAKPTTIQLDAHPALYADSWVRTPDDSVSLSGSFNELGSLGVVFDDVDSGPVRKFHFARFTVAPDPDPGFFIFEQYPVNFSGSVTTSDADGTTRSHPFSVDFPSRGSDRFNFDRDDAIDGGDIPGWLDAASVTNPNRIFRMGDVNLDGNVDNTDLGALLNNFGKTLPDMGWGDGDLNMSGTVDSNDLGLLLNGYGFESLPTIASVHRAADAIDVFAADLYEELQKEEGNIVVSPLSIATVFGMVYAGAKGQTAEEIADVFHFGDDPDIHSSFSDLISSYEKANEPTEILVANSAWPSGESTLRDEYVSAIGADYRATAQNLDYSDPAAAEKIINDWIGDNTNNRIKDLVRDLSSDTVLVLANALFFQSFWDVPFSTGATAPAPFATTNGSVVEVDMMSTFEYDLIEHHGFRTTYVDGFQALEMPFRGGAASMVFVLPPGNADSSVLPSTTLAELNAWAGMPQSKSSCVDIKLPKFETTVETDLAPVLRDVMGMPSAFGPADFSGMFHGIGPFINQVKHKAFVKVDEAGAEASAATIVEFTVCFAAGTAVLTPDGMKSIEDIKVGDCVMSRDEGDPDGCVRPKIVEELFGGSKPVMQIRVAGQVIRPTDTHPFYVRDRGWIPAGDLQIGDLLSTHRGEWKPIEELTATTEEVPVYNFRIADYHTYFVGDDENAVWAHNCCGPDLSFHADRTFHFMIRDNINSTTIMMGRIDDPTQTDNDLNPGARAATSESIEPSVGDQGDVAEPILAALPLVETSGDSNATGVDNLAGLAHESFEPCVSDDSSVESLMAAFDRVQGRGQFGVSAVDEAMQDDSLSLDWVESLDEAKELAAFGGR